MPPVNDQQPKGISIHALREEGDLFRLVLRSNAPISIHALREEGDAGRGKFHPAFQISIHALREEGDFMCTGFPTWFLNFYPRPPRGGRQSSKERTGQQELFLSTPSARRATFFCFKVFAHFSISIHALREEGDFQAPCTIHSGYNFYPRPPRGGRRSLPRCPKCRSRFLSTPSARRATWNTLKRFRQLKFLPPPSARRATNGLFLFLCRCVYFYPRPPRGGRQQKRRKHPRF